MGPALHPVPDEASLTRALLILFGGLTLLACPKLEPPPPATCARLGAKCQLPDGPLGVCEQAVCPDDSKSKGLPSCLRCTSQH